MITEKLYDEHMDEARPKPKVTLAEKIENLSANICAKEIKREKIRLAIEKLRMEMKALTLLIREITRSEVNITNRLNQMNTTRIKPSKHNYEIYDDNILYTEQAFVWYKPFNLEKRKKAVQRAPQKYGTKKCVEIDDWDGKMTSQLQDKSTCWNPNMYVELDEPFNLEKLKEAMQRFIYCGTNYHRIVEPLDIPGDYVMQKHKDREYFITLHKYGTNKCFEIDEWDVKLQLQDKSTYCNPNMYVELDEPFNLEKRKEAVQRFIYCGTNYRRIVEPLDNPGDYVMQKHKDREYVITPQKYGTNKCVEIDDWDGKMTLQLQDKSTYCNPNMYVELDEPFNLEKRKKAVQRVSSFVIVTTAFLWIITDICGQLSPIQLQQEHGSLFIWSSLLEILSFMAFVCAILAMIVVGARFSHLQRIMLIFWAIWMQVKSAKSLTAVSPPILGILFTGWHVLMEKQPPHEE